MVAQSLKEFLAPSSVVQIEEVAPETKCWWRMLWSKEAVRSKYDKKSFFIPLLIRHSVDGNTWKEKLGLNSTKGCKT
jgi:hypothetical protein